ncbi:MAG: Cna B-type domain-containing protein, partial [Clostridia bacterium]|nr:Cna B-type domain-containing protein [Clostridia bacterium]
GHLHTDECFVLVEDSFVCGKEETEGHRHTDECYYIGVGFGCGLTEEEGHVHTEECLTDETELGCGLDCVPEHFHTDACYQALEACPLEEHIHTEDCYSNLDADIETMVDWEADLPDLSEIPSTGMAVAAVANSQLGYTESTLNFEVDPDGIRHGITRYGQWYGNPYGDWSAMFAAFCLHYAGTDELPVNAGPESMRLEWEEEGLYVPADGSIADIGSLLFLRSDTDEEVTYDFEYEYEADAAAAVAIVVDFDEYGMTVIRGDSNNAVEEYYIEADDPAILGYGIVPENSPFALLALPRAADNLSYVGRSIDYNDDIFTSNRKFLIYAKSGDQYYALSCPSDISGSIVGVPITINANGSIYTEVDDINTLLWSFTYSTETYIPGYIIQNVATDLYLSPGANNLIRTVLQPNTLTKSGNGATFTRQNYRTLFNADTLTFGVAKENDNTPATPLYFGYFDSSEQCTVWLDGTMGGLSSYGGSPNEMRSVVAGSTVKLPSEWVSPSKYDYVLQGWYDVTHDRYYAPGASVIIEENSVFYADWKAATYDIGEYNAHVANTVTTNSFITTQVFDYTYLFNVLSADSTGTISSSSHSEDWTIVQRTNGDGKVDYENRDTLDFIFLDYGGDDTLDYPDNRRSGVNEYPGADKITTGIYNTTIRDALFSTTTTLPGKTYVGEGDHLFQIETNPTSDYYGYYYYDSARNAASYNQSAQRFYVYDYLEATSAELTATKSDFMPFNSPYANTNGKTVDTYESAGEEKYVYDAKYNTSEDHVSSNYAFGMKIDIDFYLPAAPGDAANKDVYGNDLSFSFSGDDDLWVLVDGELVLDIGGIHQAEDGEINFATGEVTVQGVTTKLEGVKAGAHTLTIMYLERGASHSNCAIYFNLAPRYGFTIQKEDVLTSQYLNGAEFSVYTDLECLTAAKLYNTREDSNYPDRVTNSFEVVNGKATMWGLSPGTTYYIKETRAPANADYDLPKGIIRMVLDKSGNATYDVIILEEDGSISGGFTVHGYRINEEEQQAYIVATNAPEWVEEVTSVEARKVWADGGSHSSDKITVYLTRIERDENGKITAVYRLQSAEISAATNWTHVWENLPKYSDKEQTIPVEYGVEEEYVPGYQSKIEPATTEDTVITEWTTVTSLEDGKTYLLETDNGYLATDNANSSDTGFQWLDRSTAMQTDHAKWKVTKNGDTYKLTNLSGQTITLYWGPTDFFAHKGNPPDTHRQYFSVGVSNKQIYFSYNGNTYLSKNHTNGTKLNDTDDVKNAMLFTLYTETTTIIPGAPVDYPAYKITNTPLDSSKVTSLTVNKEWDLPQGTDKSLYEQEQVTIRLLANGKDTGRTVTLNLKNNWTASFQGLPYTDEDGVIDYTVEELWTSSDWTMQYGPVNSSNSNPPTYTTTVTNKYIPKIAELPSTGSMGRTLYMLCGSSLMLFALVYGFASRRTRERRTK